MSALDFDLRDVNSMGSDFYPHSSYSKIIPAFKIMEERDGWKAYYDTVEINTSKYQTLNDLERDPTNIYYKFTEAVKANPNAYKEYLGALYQATENYNTRPYWDQYGKYDDTTKTFTVYDNKIPDFASWYNKARTDGKFGYFHLTPPLLKDLNTGEKKMPSGNQDINGENKKGKKDTPSLKIENPYQVIPLLEQPEDRKDIKPWLTPIIAGHVNDWLTAGKVADEKKKGISIPNEIAPYKHAIVTNGYFTRSQMKKQAKELEWLASQPVAGGSKEQERYRRPYLEQAQSIRDKALALKQETFNRTSKEVNDAANWNRAVATEVANKKNAKIAAAKQLLANINAREVETKGTIQSKFITDAANEIRQAEYINKLDKKTKEKQRDIYDIQLKLDALIEDYKSINSKNPWNDEEFRIAINTLAEQEQYSRELVSIEGDDKIKEYWEDKKNHDSTVKNLFDLFEKKKQKSLDIITKEYQNLQKKQNIKAQETTYVSNTPEFVENFYNLFKTGGSVTKAQIQAEQSKFNAIQRSQDRFHERLYKQNRDAHKNTTERLRIAQTNLDKALGRLSQEDMLLLKKLFS